MQESPEYALNEAKRIIDGISERKLGDLCSSNIAKRQQVINRILGGLDVNDINDANIFQAIPIDLLGRQEVIGALCFAETNIKNGSIFALEVLESIVSAVIRRRKDIDTEGDIESVDTITSLLHDLFRAILEVETYRNNPDIYLLIGADAEYIGKPDEAIDSYKRAMALGSVESYLRIAAIYNSQENYALGIETLEAGYKLSGDIIFLKQLIRMYYDNGNLELASAKYSELSLKSNGNVTPFLVYKGRIENDTNLDVFENLMDGYLGEGALVPTESLTSLALSASEYIIEQVELVNIEIEGMARIPENEQSDIDIAVYMCLITRRLYLMQNHIITLKDSRYLELYLDEINKFGINGNDYHRTVIRTFFEEYFSIIALAYYRIISKNQKISVEDMDFFEMIRVHIVHIAALFGQGSYYDLLLDKMQPMVDECLRLEGSDDEISDPLENKNELKPIKDESEFYASLPTWLQKSYEDFIDYFDRKYGTYYRRSIQGLARNSEYDESVHSDIFRNNSDIALLFWIEKMLYGGLSSEDAEPDMEDIIEGYHLDALEPVNVLLFAAFLSEAEAQFENTIDLLINTPGMLDFPNTLYLLMEALLHLDTDEERENVIVTLNELCREQYEASDFFDHINHIFVDVSEDPEASNEDISSILFAQAFACLFQKNIESAIVYFQEVAEYEPMRAYREMGDIYNEQGEYEKAIQSYTESYRIKPSVVGISRLLGCSIEGCQFYNAKEYIDIALRDDYDVSGFIFAYYLRQGKTKEALEKMLEIIDSNGQKDLIVPMGTLEALGIIINSILEDSETSYEIDTLKILASYVSMQFLAEKGVADSAKFIEHFGYIAMLFDQYEGEELYELIESTIGLMVCDQSDPGETIDRAILIMRIIQAHGYNVYEQLIELLKKYQQADDLEHAKNTFNDINTMVGIMALLLQEFPDSDIYVMEWRKKTNLLATKHDLAMLHKAPETLQ